MDWVSGASGIIGNTPTPKNFYAAREREWKTNQYNYEQRVQADREADRQREFAQNGIRWKVQDAIAAGLAPLAAVGAQGASYSPQSVGQMEPAEGTGETLAKMGQSVGRAAAASMDSDSRDLMKLQMASAKLDLEGKAIDNQYKAAQLNQLQNSSAGPGMGGSKNSVIDGQPNGRVKDKPMERVVSAKDRQGTDPGAVNEVGFMQGSDGTLYPLPAQDAKERMEDSLYETMHFLRNGIMPNFTGGNPPKKGYRWDGRRQGYTNEPKKKLPKNDGFINSLMGY